jgi:hypothetical protein
MVGGAREAGVHFTKLNISLDINYTFMAVIIVQIFDSLFIGPRHFQLQHEDELTGVLISP